MPQWSCLSSFRQISCAAVVAAFAQWIDGIALPPAIGLRVLYTVAITCRGWVAPHVWFVGVVLFRSPSVAKIISDYRTLLLCGVHVTEKKNPLPMIGRAVRPSSHNEIQNDWPGGAALIAQLGFNASSVAILARPKCMTRGIQTPHLVCCR